MAASFSFPDYQKSYQGAGKNSGLAYHIACQNIGRAEEYSDDEYIVFAFGQFTRLYGIFDGIFGGATNLAFYSVEKNGFVKIKTVKNIKEGDTVEISLKEIFHAAWGSDDVFVCVFSEHDMNCIASITNNPQKVAVELAAEQAKFDEEAMGKALDLPDFPGSGLVQSLADLGGKAVDAARKGMDDVNDALESTGSIAKSLTVAVIICAAIYFYNETKSIRR